MSLSRILNDDPPPTSSSYRPTSPRATGSGPNGVNMPHLQRPHIADDEALSVGRVTTAASTAGGSPLWSRQSPQQLRPEAAQYHDVAPRHEYDGARIPPPSSSVASMLHPGPSPRHPNEGEQERSHSHFGQIPEASQMPDGHPALPTPDPSSNLHRGSRDYDQVQFIPHGSHYYRRRDVLRTASASRPPPQPSSLTSPHYQQRPDSVPYEQYVGELPRSLPIHPTHTTMPPSSYLTAPHLHPHQPTARYTTEENPTLPRRPFDSLGVSTEHIHANDVLSSPGPTAMEGRKRKRSVDQSLSPVSQPSRKQARNLDPQGYPAPPMPPVQGHTAIGTPQNNNGSYPSVSPPLGSGPSQIQQQHYPSSGSSISSPKQSRRFSQTQTQSQPQTPLAQLYAPHPLPAPTPHGHHYYRSPQGLSSSGEVYSPQVGSPSYLDASSRSGSHSYPPDRVETLPPMVSPRNWEREQGTRSPPLRSPLQTDNGHVADPQQLEQFGRPKISRNPEPPAGSSSVLVPRAVTREDDDIWRKGSSSRDHVQSEPSASGTLGLASISQAQGRKPFDGPPSSSALPPNSTPHSQTSPPQDKSNQSHHSPSLRSPVIHSQPQTGTDLHPHGPGMLTNQEGDNSQADDLPRHGHTWPAGSIDLQNQVSLPADSPPKSSTLGHYTARGMSSPEPAGRSNGHPANSPHPMRIHTPSPSRDQPPTTAPNSSNTTPVTKTSRQSNGTASLITMPSATFSIVSTATEGSPRADASGASTGGIVKRKRSRRPNPKPVSLGDVPPDDTASVDPPESAKSPQGLESSTPQPLSTLGSKLRTVRPHPYTNASVDLQGQIAPPKNAPGRRKPKGTTSPTTAAKREDSGNGTRHSQFLDPYSSSEGEGEHSDNREPHPRALGAAIGIGCDAGEAAEELEQMTDGEPQSREPIPKPARKKAVSRPKKKVVAVRDLTAADDLERALSPSLSLPDVAASAPKKRKRAVNGDANPKPSRSKKKHVPSASGAATPSTADATIAAAAAALTSLANGDVFATEEDGALADDDESAAGFLEELVGRSNGDGAPEVEYETAPNISLPASKKLAEPVVLARRLIQLEEMQRKVWVNLARKDIPKAYKLVSSGYSHQINHHKKLCSMVMTNAKRATSRSSKASKDNQIKARRITREMLLYWKRNEKEEGVSRKRAEKEALDKIKADEEKREAARQARKLEFLLTQTELYSHFVGKKLKTADLEKDPAVGSASVEAEPGIDITSAEKDLGDLDFDQDDKDNLTRHAAAKAHEQVIYAMQRAKEFDFAAAQEREKNEAIARQRSAAVSEAPTPETPSTAEADVLKPSVSPLVDFDSDELNFQNPTSMADVQQIAQPNLLSITLKDYQLKGLRWLASLYEQGINGILADEMGLGKTVQSISVLAYLIETHDIWGPFLVIAPASTLFNWQQELARFVPRVKALPYWGNPKERALLRKYWSRKEISYNEDAPFNVVITSYQMVVQDAQYFQKVKWQYMILDEAQAIKSSTSARWKTLLGFPCRNRLLLTGTPIQNSMHELWALLHFIMPTLFDSHDEFTEWFSKDIENHAENKGESNLNEHQIRRLHLILKPFMLRRIKKNVQNELGDKIEIDLFCDLSPRQRALYRALRANASLSEILAKASRQGDADSARSLMNLVMQFRKVCNHPDLFQRAEIVTPYAFCAFAKTNITREKEYLFYPDTPVNPICLSLPRLFYMEGTIRGVPGESSFGKDSTIMASMLNIWRTAWIKRSVDSNTSFSFLPFLKLSPSDATTIFTSSSLGRVLLKVETDTLVAELSPFARCPEFSASQLLPIGQVRVSTITSDLDTASLLPPLGEIGSQCWQASCLSRPAVSACRIPKAVAPPIRIHISDRSFVESAYTSPCGVDEELTILGLPPRLEHNLHMFNIMAQEKRILPSGGLLSATPTNRLPSSPTLVPEPHALITDSAKLARLDTLLDELKSAGHRVLIYFQMTRMIDLMEEYMTYRKHRYLRLDGSSKLEDRRDMVMDWQTNPEIFVFLLSTRAGGLGINLTAADTVIFYDHDWNPSNDSQAMDRAHRLGQTRQVTVYRLITKGTIDERIVQLARVKKDVQDIVVGNRQFGDGNKTNDIASLLLNDELAAGDSSLRAENQDYKAQQALGNTWRDESGDDFFTNQSNAQATLEADVNDDIGDVPTGTSTPVKKKRKPRGPNKKPKKATGTAALGDNLPEDI